jgi:hypothetical protein
MFIAAERYRLHCNPTLILTNSGTATRIRDPRNLMRAGNVARQWPGLEHKRTRAQKATPAQHRLAPNICACALHSRYCSRYDISFWNAWTRPTVSTGPAQCRPGPGWKKVFWNLVLVCGRPTAPNAGPSFQAQASSML